MKLTLHANARTTPAMRKYIQGSDRSSAALARELGISVSTVYKWRKRADQQDRSPIAQPSKNDPIFR